MLHLARAEEVLTRIPQGYDDSLDDVSWSEALVGDQRVDVGRANVFSADDLKKEVKRVIERYINIVLMR